MRKLEKLVAIILTLSMLFGMTPITAFATGDPGTPGTEVCKIGDVGYATLQQAVSAANEGDTIWMIADDESAQKIVIDKSLTIEFEGKSLPYTLMEITGASTKAVLTDRIGGTTVNHGENSTIRGDALGHTIYVHDGASLVLNGKPNTSISHYYQSAGYLNNLRHEGSGDLTINGGQMAYDASSFGHALGLYNCTGNIIINNGRFAKEGALLIVNCATANIQIREGMICYSGDVNVSDYLAEGSYLSSDSNEYDKIVVNDTLFINPDIPDAVDCFGVKRYVGRNSTKAIVANPTDKLVLDLPVLDIPGSLGTTTTYEWKNGETVVGTASSYTIDSVPDGHNATYTVTATQGSKSITTAFLVVTDASMLPHIDHAVCGEASCTHTGHDVVEYLAIPASYQSGELYGNYYLDRDIIIDGTGCIVVPRGQVLNLCLNGHVIKRSDWYRDKSCIQVYGTLNLCDCNTTTTHQFGLDSTDGNWALVNENGVHTLTGGVITNVSSDYSNMSAIAVGGYDEEGSCAGTFNMYGGNIVGNKSHGGSGVSVSEDGSVFNMYGGAICGNASKYTCGGVYVGATFNMYGGEISNNIAQNGGGVFVSSTFNMYDGKISYNTASQSGGGVYVGGTFNMYGGEIIDNSSQKNAGGVWVNGDCTFNVSVEDGKMGKITGNTCYEGNGAAMFVQNWANVTLKNVLIENNNSTYPNTAYNGSAIEYRGSSLTLGGNVQIKNNHHTANNSPRNLIYKGDPIIIADEGLADTAYISISVDSYDEFVGANDTDYSSRFVCDDVRYHAVYTPDKTIKAEPWHSHKLCGELYNYTSSCMHGGGNGHGSDSQRYYLPITQAFVDENGGTIPLNNGDAYYLAEDITITSAIRMSSESGAVSADLCLNGHSITQETEGQYVFFIYKDATINICDCSADAENPYGKGKITHNEYGPLPGDNMIGSKGSGIALYSDDATKKAKLNLYGGIITGNIYRQDRLQDELKYVFAMDKHAGGIQAFGNSDVTIYNGLIEKNTTYFKGGGILIDSSSTFKMYGGNVRDNTSRNNVAPAMYLAGESHFYGGKIEYHSSYNGEWDDFNRGNIVKVENATLTMYNGFEISKNQTNGSNARGVVNVGANATFVMEGGSFTNNNVNGGVVFVNEPTATFKMNGGTISNNNSEDMRIGAVSVEGGTAEFYGGEIKDNTAGRAVYTTSSSTIKVGGKPYIYNNLDDSNKQSNLFLQGNNKIQIVDWLETEAKIGVKLSNSTNPTASTPTVFATHTDFDGIFSDYFVSDADFKVYRTTTDGEVALYTEYPHLHNICGNQYCSHESAGHGLEMFIPITQADVTANSGKLPVESGKAYYLKENITLSGTEFTDISFDVKLCLNGKTITTDVDQYTAIRVSDGGNFTLCDCTVDYVNPQSHGEGVILGNNYPSGTICVMVDDMTQQAEFTMYGGIIKGNNGTSAQGGVVGLNRSKINLLGGKITENNGSGVDVSGELYVGGNAVVSGNGDNANPRNIMLGGGALVKFSDAVMLTEGASFGITTFATPTNDSPVIISVATNGNYSEYFFADNSELYEIVAFDGVTGLVLKNALTHKHVPCGDAYCNHGHAQIVYKALTQANINSYVEDNSKIVLPRGNYYLAEDIKLPYSIENDGAYYINLCLNGKTLTAPDRKLTINFATEDESSFNLCDCVYEYKNYNVFNGCTASVPGGAIYADGADDTRLGGISISGSNTSVALYAVNFVDLRGSNSFEGLNSLTLEACWFTHNYPLVDNSMFKVSNRATGEPTTLSMINNNFKYNSGNSTPLISFAGFADGHEIEMPGLVITYNAVDRTDLIGIEGGNANVVLAGATMSNNSNYARLSSTPFKVQYSSASFYYVEVGTSLLPPLTEPIHVATRIPRDAIGKFTTTSGIYKLMPDRNSDGTYELYFGNHNHKACADACTHSNHSNDVEYEPLTQSMVDANHGALPIQLGGNYFLAEDIIVTTVSDVYATYQYLNLCLNGHTITSNLPDGNDNFIKINQGICTLCDCSKDAENPHGKGAIIGKNHILASIYVDGRWNLDTGTYNNSVFTMYGGTLKGNNSTGTGAVLGVGNGSKVYIYGGKITENSADAEYGTLRVTVGSELYLGGNAVVDGNNGGNITFRSNSPKIRFSSEHPLTEGARFGVSLANDYPRTDGVATITEALPSADYGNYFYADDANYELFVMGDALRHVQKHKHNACGDVNCTHEGHGEEIVYKALTQANFTGGQLASGNYYLAEDIALTNPITMEKKVTVNLCLNGKLLKAPSNDYAISFVRNSNDNLTICDCGTNERSYTVEADGLATLDATHDPTSTNKIVGGAIMGAGDGTASGGIKNFEDMGARDSLRLYNVNFANNSNRALTTNYDGFYVLDMDNCSFIGNSGSVGVMYVISSAASAKLNISNLTIKHNVVKGNILRFDVVPNVKLHNCLISDNRIDTDYKYYHAVDFGGDGRSATLSGKIEIKNNTYTPAYNNGEERGVWVGFGATITLENLEEGSEIELSANSLGFETNPFVCAMTAVPKDYVKYLKATNDFVIDPKRNADDSDKRDIFFGHHAHTKSGDASEMTHPATITYKPLTQADVDNHFDNHLPVNGAYFLAEDIVVSEQTQVYELLHLCLNGYTIRSDGQILGDFINVGQFGTAIVTDCSADDTNPYGKGGITDVRTRSDVIEVAGGEFEMYKTSISGCEANQNCHIVHFYGDNSKFTIIDGEIFNFSHGCNFEFYNPVNNCEFKVGGKTKISSLTAAGISLNNSYITIADKPLVEGAHITVYTRTMPTASNPIKITNETNGNYAEFFETTNENCEVVAFGGITGIVLKNSLIHKHKACGDANCTHEGHDEEIVYKALTQANIGDYLLDEYGTFANGNYYLAEDINLPIGLKLKAGTINLCLNGHRMKAKDGNEFMSSDLQGGETQSITICDCGEDTYKYDVTDSDVHFLSDGATYHNGILGGHFYADTPLAYFDIGGYNYWDNVTPPTVTFNMYGVDVVGADSIGIVTGTAHFENCRFIGNKSHGSLFMFPHANKVDVTLKNFVAHHNEMDRFVFEALNEESTLTIDGCEITENIMSAPFGSVYLIPSGITLGGKVVIKDNYKRDSNTLVVSPSERSAILVFETNGPVKTNGIEADSEISIEYDYSVLPDANGLVATGIEPSEIKYFSTKDTSKILFARKLGNGKIDLYHADHKHNACGEASCSHDPAHNEAVFSEAFGVASTGGYIKLENDAHYLLNGDFMLSADDQIVIGKDDESAVEVTLCLNGFKLYRESESAKPMIAVLKGATLNICDCQGGGRISNKANSNFLWAITSAGTINMYSGIIGNEVLTTTGGVFNEGIFNMYGGEISNNYTQTGGGVKSTNTFNMYGGEIKNNKVVDVGGGVYTVTNPGSTIATFNMYGGSISNNEAVRSGGVMTNGTGTTFNMYGGEIKDNRATSEKNNVNKLGGGVFVGYETNFNMLGGSITGNYARENGGGVYTIGVTTLGKESIIKDNTRGVGNSSTMPGNLLLVDTYDSAKIKLYEGENKLTGNAYIGVSTVNSAIQAENYLVEGQTNASNYVKYFHADSDSKDIVGTGDKIILAKKHAKHAICVNCDGHDSGCGHEHSENLEYKPLTQAMVDERNGDFSNEFANYYLFENITLDTNQYLQLLMGSALCLNGHVITGGIIVYTNANGTALSIGDCVNTKQNGFYVDNENNYVYDPDMEDLDVAMMRTNGAIVNSKLIGAIGGNIQLFNVALCNTTLYVDDVQVDMYDGVIFGNKETAIFIYESDYGKGDFNMYGGEITCNNPVNSHLIENNGKFIMHGGKIVDNTMYCNSDRICYALHNETGKSITVYGGEIRNNDYVLYKTVNAHEGTSVDISHVGGANVALEATSSLTANIADDVNGVNMVGVSLYMTPDANVYLQNEKAKAYVYADNDVIEGNKLKSGAPYHEHDDQWGDLANYLVLNAGDKYYLTGDVIKDKFIVQGSGEITICLNGYSIIQTGDPQPLFICTGDENPKVVIINCRDEKLDLGGDNSTYREYKFYQNSITSSVRGANVFVNPNSNNAVAQGCTVELRVNRVVKDSASSDETIMTFNMASIPKLLDPNSTTNETIFTPTYTPQRELTFDYQNEGSLYGVSYSVPDGCNNLMASQAIFSSDNPSWSCSYDIGAEEYQDTETGEFIYYVNEYMDFWNEREYSENITLEAIFNYKNLNGVQTTDPITVKAKNIHVTSVDPGVTTVQYTSQPIELHPTLKTMVGGEEELVDESKYGVRYYRINDNGSIGVGIYDCVNPGQYFVHIFNKSSTGWLTYEDEAFHDASPEYIDGNAVDLANRYVNCIILEIKENLNPVQLKPIYFGEGIVNLLVGETATKTVTNPNASSTVTYSSSNPSVVSVNSATGEIEALASGTATIMAVCTADGVTPVYASYVVNVVKEVITITADDVSVEYGTELDDITFTYTASKSGVTLGDAICDVSYEAGRPCGLYDIRISGLNSDIYDFVYVPGKLSVTPKQLTSDDITITGVNKIYDGLTNAALTASITSGVLAGDLVNVLVNGVFDAPEAGDRTISYTVSGISGTHSSNYTLQAYTGSVTAEILKATVSVSVPAKTTYVYDGEEKGINVIAYANGAYFDKFNVTYTKNGVTASPVDVGTYDAVISLTDTNYVYETVPTAQLIIKEAQQEFFTIEGVADSVTYGDAQFTLQADGVPSGSTVTYTLKQGDAVEVTSEGVVTIVGVGTVTIEATSTLENHAEKKATRSFAVHPKTLTVSASAAAEKVYDGEKTVDVTLTLDGVVSGDDVSAVYQSSAAVSADVETNKAVFVNGITLSGADKSKYQLSANSTQTTINVTKRKITAAAITASDKIYDGSDRADYTITDLTGVLDAEKPFVSIIGNATFEDANAGADKVVTLNGYTLTGVKSGNYELDITGDIETTATIEKANVSFILGTLSYTYDGISKNVSVSASVDGVTFTDYTVSYKKDGANVTPVEAGEYTVEIALADTTNYKTDYTPLTLTIVQANQSAISITGLIGTIDYGARFVLHAVGGNGNGAVTWTSDNASVATVDPVTGEVNIVGTGEEVTITATKAGDDNYANESTAQVSFVPQKKSVGFKITDLTKTYTGDEKSVVVTPTVTGATYSVSYTDDEGNSITGAPIDAGTYYVDVSATGNYSGDASAVLVIKNATIDVSGYTFMVDDAVYGSTPSVTKPADSEYPTGVSANVTYTGSGIQGETDEMPRNVGKYVAILTISGENYIEVKLTDRFEIEKKPLTVTPTSVSRKYGEQNPIFEVEYDGFVYTDDVSAITIEPTATTQATITSTVGTYDIIAHGGYADNYVFTYENGTLTITEASGGNFYIIGGNATPYVGNSFILTAHYNNERPTVTWESDNPTVASVNAVTGEVEILKAGSATITATMADERFSSTLTASFKLNAEYLPETQNPIYFNDVTIRRNVGDPSFIVKVLGAGDDAVITYSSSNTDVAQVNATTGEVTIKKAGTVAIKATATKFNCADVYATYSLIVEKIPVTITVNDASIVYGTGFEGTTISYPAGVDQGDFGGTVSYGTDYTAGDDVGRYTITASGITSDKYEISYKSGRLSVTPKVLTVADIKVTAQDKYYDATTDVILATEIVSGIYGADKVTALVRGSFDSADVETDAGVVIDKNISYSIYDLSGANAHNYIISDDVIEGVVTAKIKKAPVTIICSELINRVYDGEAQIFDVSAMAGTKVLARSNYTVKYNGENEAIAVGTYAITVELTADAMRNYEIEPFTAQLVISEATQEIFYIEGVPETVYYGDSFKVTTSDADGDVTYRITSGSDFATIDASTGELKTTGVGKVTIAATSEMTGYTPRTATRSFDVKKRILTPTATAANRVYNAENGVEVNITLSDDIVGTDEVTAVGTGTMANSDAGRGKVVYVSDITLEGAQKELYTLSTTALQTTVDIEKADITSFEITAQDKKYDKTVNAIATVSEISGIFASDEGFVEILGKATFDTADSDNNKTVTFTATGVSGVRSTNYKLAVTEAITTATIEPLKVEFVIGQTSFVYSGEGKAISVSANDEFGRLFKAFSVTYDDGDELPVDSGSYTAKIILDDNVNYTTEQGEITVTITDATQAGLTIIGLPGTIRYKDSISLEAIGGEDGGTYTWSVKNDVDVAIDAEDEIATITIGDAVGEKVEIEVVKSVDNYEDVSAKITFVPTRRNVTFELDNLTQIYGETSEITVTPSEDDVTYDVTYDGGEMPENAGSYIVEVVANGNYVGNATATLVINRAKATGTLAGIDSKYVYGDEILAYAEDIIDETQATITYAGSGIYVPTEEAPKHVGAYTATLTVTGDNYVTHTVTKNFTIEKATIRVKAKNETRSYGKANPVFTVLYNEEDFKYDDTKADILAEPTATTIATALSTVGDYDIVVSGGSDENYKFEYENGTLTVVGATDAELVVTGAAGTVEAGQTFTLHAFYGNTKVDAEWESSDPEIATIDSESGIVKTIKSGTVTFTATADENYNNASAELTISVSKRRVTLTAIGTVRVYNGLAQHINLISDNPDFVPVVEGDGKNVNVEYSLIDNGNVTEAVDVGQYAVSFTIVDDTYSGGGNTTLYINKETVVVKPANITKEYGDKPTYALEIIAGANVATVDEMMQFASFESRGERTSAVVGEYDIKLTLSSEGDHNRIFLVSEELGVMTIEKAPLTVIVSDVTKEYGESNPTATVTYEGFKNEQTGKVLKGSLEIVYDDIINEDTPVGEYAEKIYAKGYQSDNYDITYVAGDVTVTKKFVKPRISTATEKYIKVVLDKAVEDMTEENFSVVCNGDEIDLTSVTISGSGKNYTLNGSFKGGNKYLIKVIYANENEEVDDIQLTAKVEKTNAGGGSTGGTSAGGASIGGGGLSGVISTRTYTVTFNSNGGTTIGKVNVEKGKTVAEPTTPIKSGFDFGGWYSNVTLTQKYDFTTKVTKSIILYAKWTKSAPAEWVNPFVDVNKNDWFYDSICFVYTNGLMNGVSSTMFEPNSMVTRAMLVTVLYRLDKEPSVNKSIVFSDIENGSYYESAVIWAKQNGIVKGVSENDFAPDLEITREQVAAILYRYAMYKGYDASIGDNTSILDYADYNDISEYAIPAMKYVVGSGLIKGKTASTLNPADTATRAEIATILERFIKANEVK